MDAILSLINNLGPLFKIDKLGRSSEERDIYSNSFGTGNKSILIWTQMHGIDGNGTKAVFDLLQFLKNLEKNMYN